MAYAIEYEPEAIADLKNLTPAVRDRVLGKIEWLAKNFERINPQPLKGNLAGFYKLRIGDYRVIYELDVEARIVVIAQIGHRRKIYD